MIVLFLDHLIPSKLLPWIINVWERDETRQFQSPAIKQSRRQNSKLSTGVRRMWADQGDYWWHLVTTELTPSDAYWPMLWPGCGHTADTWSLSPVHGHNYELMRELVMMLSDPQCVPWDNGSNVERTGCMLSSVSFINKCHLLCDHSLTNIIITITELWADDESWPSCKVANILS